MNTFHATWKRMCHKMISFPFVSRRARDNHKDLLTANGKDVGKTESRSFRIEYFFFLMEIYGRSKLVSSKTTECCFLVLDAS